MTRPGFERIDRVDMLVEMARLVSRRSSCSRKQVGCLIARENRIIVTGYNGTPAGTEHCDHTCDCGVTDKYGDTVGAHDVDCAAIAPCTRAVHAEANAIAWAAREGLAVHGTLLITTMAPCVPCAQLIIAAGIEHVMYLEDYRDMSGVELMQDAGLEVWQ